MESEKHIWSREKTDALISTYRDHIEEFRNPFKRQKLLWENVANKMKIFGFENVTGNNCDRKWRNLKSTFKKIYYDTERTEESKLQWDFYNDLVVLFTKDCRKEMGVERKSRTLEPPVDSPESEENNLAIKNEPEINEEYLDDYFQDMDENEVELELDEEYLNEEELEAEDEVVEEHDQQFHIQYNEEVATTDEVVEESRDESAADPAPLWFTQFVSRYDADQIDLKTCLSNILETEKQQMTLMNEIFKN